MRLTLSYQWRERWTIVEWVESCRWVNGSGRQCQGKGKEGSVRRSKLRRGPRITRQTRSIAQPVRIVVGIGLIAVALLAVQVERSRDSDAGFLVDLLVTIGPELAGIGIGVVLIDALNERRQDAQLKEQLIVQMASSHAGVSGAAIQTLRARGWLEDGSLTGRHLSRANLRGANLVRANLDEALMWEARLSGAGLSKATLKGAQLVGAQLDRTDLTGADLHKAQLWHTNLKKAELFGANLEGATMMGSNLKGADLRKSNLRGVDLTNAVVTTKQLLDAATLEGATMPDGVVLQGSLETDGPTLEQWIRLRELAQAGQTGNDDEEE
jgi:hypothetical protein